MRGEARADLETARIELQGSLKLQKQGLLSDVAVAAAQARRESALANLHRQELNLQPGTGLTGDRALLAQRAGWEPAELIALLESRPNNTLALDYLLAFDLLQCRVANFVKDLERFWLQKNSPLPRHYQERPS